LKLLKKKITISKNYLTKGKKAVGIITCHIL